MRAHTRQLRPQSGSIDETLETRGAAARRGASRGGRAGRSYTYTAAAGRSKDNQKAPGPAGQIFTQSQTSESDDTGRFHVHLIRSQLSASPHAHWACPPLEQSMPRDRPPVPSLIVIHTAQSCATTPHGSVISAPRRTQRLHTQGFTLGGFANASARAADTRSPPTSCNTRVQQGRLRLAPPSPRPWPSGRA